METSEIFFVLLNLILKLYFSCLKSFTWFLNFEFLMLRKIVVNENFPRISKFSISGIGQNQKLRNLGNFIFLVIVTFRVLFPIAFLSGFLLVKYITRNAKNPPKHRKLGNFNPCSLMGYSCKMETNLLILILIRKGNLVKEI